MDVLHHSAGAVQFLRDLPQLIDPFNDVGRVVDHHLAGGAKVLLIYKRSVRDDASLLVRNLASQGLHPLDGGVHTALHHREYFLGGDVETHCALAITLAQRSQALVSSP